MSMVQSTKNETTKYYFLKSVSPSGEAYDGFKWPLKKGAIVRPTKWTSEPECGDGLHGFLNGVGDATLASASPDAVWIVFSASEYVDLDGKAKVPEALVEFFGPREEAAAWIAKKCPGHAVMYLQVTAGYKGTATAGYGGTATAGYKGTATAGYGGTATAGYRGTATAGNYGSATAGNYGSATAGNYGSATAGNYGSATAGEYGTATAGEHGQIRLTWYDGRRFRLAVGYVGEAGIEADVPYKAENGKLVKA